MFVGVLLKEARPIKKVLVGKELFDSHTRNIKFNGSVGLVWHKTYLPNVS